MWQDHKQEDRQELIDFMKVAIQKGYRCFIQKENMHLWGFFITPKDNILYVQVADFRTGWKFYLQYIPSRQNGSGCQCSSNPVTELTIEALEQEERAGLEFAYKLRAELYKNSEQYLKKLWNPYGYIEIKGDI